MNRVDDTMWRLSAMFLSSPVWKTALYCFAIAAMTVLFLSTCDGERVLAQETPVPAIPKPRPDPELRPSIEPDAVTPTPGRAKGKSFKLGMNPLNCTTDSLELQSYLTHREGETRLAVGPYGKADSQVIMEIWVNKQTRAWSIILVNRATGSACFYAGGTMFEPSLNQPVTISPSSFVEEREG